MKQQQPTDHSNPSAMDEAPFLERLIFNNRKVLLIFFFLVTIILCWQTAKLRPEASFEKMIPTYNPYIKNYLENKVELKGMGNAVRIAVERTDGDIFDAGYLETLEQINDEVFFITGVDRGVLKSLWTPITRWTEVTEQGFDGGAVIPDTYDGSSESLKQVRINVLKSGEVGSLVANNFTSSIVYAPLMDFDPETGKPLDYQKLSRDLETLVRDKYQSDTIRIHMTGFAKIVGDLIEGSTRVFLFFMIAFVILLLILLFNSRCWRSTVVRGVSSTVAVIWQLGLLKSFGYGLNPYSMLVPFLMFALGVSHGIQMFNQMAHEMARGEDKLTAARLAYRKIYKPGLAALLTDCVGFALLMVIRIGVIQDIAVGASIGVAVVAFTDLTLLPVLMSYTGISESSIKRLKARGGGCGIRCGAGWLK